MTPAMDREPLPSEREALERDEEYLEKVRRAALYSPSVSGMQPAEMPRDYDMGILGREHV